MEKPLLQQQLLLQQQRQEISSNVVITSPASCISETGSSSNNNNNENPAPVQVNPVQPPLTPKTIARSENNPYPTTFVQADTSNFKQVVQMLTGSTDPTKASRPPTASAVQLQPDASPAQKTAIPPIKTAPKKQGFRLYERRNSLKNTLMINTLLPGLSQHNAPPGFSPRNNHGGHHNHQQHYHEILSPSMLDFPKLALSSPVTPLTGDPFGKSSSPSLGSSLSSEEDRAIAEKGFYLHPSQTNTPRDSEPQLLPLFPVTSPRVSGASS